MAKAASLESNCKQYHLGCVAFYRNTMLAIGYNELKTSPMQKKYNKYRGFDVEASDVRNSIHAEMKVLSKIKNLDIDFTKIELYIYREHANGSSAKARPCIACMKAIKDMNIKKIHYTTEDGWCTERLVN